MLTSPGLASALFAAAIALPVMSAAAAQDSEPVASEDIEEILVTGRRPDALRELLRNFVMEIGDPVSRRHGFARWQHRLCVGVFNLPHQPSAQYLADRISLIAQEAGLRTGDPGCSPNLKIVFSPDARELADSMVKASPAMFRPFGGEGGTTQGLAALERFKTSDAPVRWWQITMVVDEQGMPAMALPHVADFSDMSSGAGVPVTRGIASRLKRPTSDAIWGSLIIVDAGKVSKVQWPQLASYLAMVGLAQVDPDALPTGYESILNLFRAAKPPPELTEMDFAYLRGLYQMDTMVMPHIQRGSLVNWMMRESTRLQD